MRNSRNRWRVGACVLAAYLAAWAGTIVFVSSHIEGFIVRRAELPNLSSSATPARLSQIEMEAAQKWRAEHKDDWRKFQPPAYQHTILACDCMMPFLFRVRWAGHRHWKTPDSSDQYRSGYGVKSWVLLTPMGFRVLSDQVEWGQH